MAPCVVTCRSTHNADIVGVPLDAMFGACPPTLSAFAVFGKRDEAM
jgi:hypothetical protein